MAKKKEEEVPAGSPAWMATFSDLMNLLLCFFVLLFSMSSTDAQKYADVAASLSESFNNTISIFENQKQDSVVDLDAFPKNVQQVENFEEYEDDTRKVRRRQTLRSSIHKHCFAPFSAYIECLFQQACQGKDSHIPLLRRDPQALKFSRWLSPRHRIAHSRKGRALF